MDDKNESPVKDMQIQSTKKSQSTKSKNLSDNVSENVRRQMIAESAYYRAEQRGFDIHGKEDEDWYHAEKEVNKILKNMKLQKKRETK